MRFACLAGVALLLLGSWSAVPAQTASRRRALLIGVGKFNSHSGVRALQGPKKDVEALRTVLVERWGFAASDVRMLPDAPGREEILRAIDDEVRNAAPGDFVLIYFSGHGTSFWDPGAGGYGLMSATTGGLVPGDIAPGSDTKMYAQLIVGDRDLRPRFSALEAKADVLVLFDACFSGYTARSALAMESRDAELFPPGSLPALRPAAGTPEPWPYKRLIYMSGSAHNEKAWEITESAIRGGRVTYDGGPHGAFTNALLIALNGSADTDHDGKITYRELHAYVYSQVQPRDGQHPLLYPRDAVDLLDRPVFNGARAPRASAVATAGKLRVRLLTPDPALRAAIAANPRVEVSDGEHEIAIRQVQASRWELLHTSGAAFRDPLVSREEVVARVARQALAHEIVTASFPDQTFNIRLQLAPEGEGVYFLGDHLRLKAQPERAAALLLLNIDPEGIVQVIYPYTPGDVRKVAALETVTAVDSAVIEPVGTEFLKVIGFDEAPGSLAKWAGKSIRDEKEIDEVLRLIRAAGRSQTLQAVYTGRRH